MDDGQMVAVPQIDGTNPNPTPDAAALAMTGNTMTDLQSIAKEMGISVDSNGNVVEAPAQPAPVAAQPQAPQPKAAPAQPQAAEQPATNVEVPRKFQNPDGTPNAEKIAKSMQSVEEALALYKAKERELSQTQNRVNNTTPIPQAPQVAPAQSMSPLEIQMAQDLINESAAQGVQLDQRLAIAQARVMARGLEAKHQAELSATEQMRQRMDDYQRTLELKDMIEKDENLLSEAMIKTLAEVRRDNPWLNNAPEPWKAAYHYHTGRNGHAQQVQTPNPTGQTVRPPATPVGPVARVQKTVDLSDKRAIQGLSDADLEAAVRKLHPGFRGK